MRRRGATLSVHICLLVIYVLLLSIFRYLWVQMYHIHISGCLCLCVLKSVSCDRAEVQTLLASEFSAVTPLPITLSSLTACTYLCVRVCMFTQPPGCNDGSRRLLFHSRQVRTYSSQRPAKLGDTLTVTASLHHGCPLFRFYSGYSLQTKKNALILL